MPTPSLRTRRRLFQTLALLALVACEEGSCDYGGKSAPPAQPQKSVTYAERSMRTWAGVPVTSNTPTAHNFTPSGFAALTALPTGLALDPLSGAISGTPQVPQAVAEYPIEVAEDGVARVTARVEIEVLEAVAPSGLSYAPQRGVTTQGGTLPAMQPSFSGVVESFSVSPALPAGLVLDPQSGVIGGVASGAAGVTQHVVTASNPLGQAQAPIEIEVTPALRVQGLLVASNAALGVDVYGRRGPNLSPIDALDCGGLAAIATVATPDARFVFVACSDGGLYRASYDARTGRTGELALVGSSLGARHLLVTLDSRALLAIGDAAVSRYELASDGNVCCATSVPVAGPPTAVLLASNERLVVATSSPGSLTVYTTEPALAQVGATLTLGPSVSVASLANFEAGRVFHAATSTYDVSTSTQSGAARVFRLSSASEMANGAAAIVQTQSLARGAELTDVLEYATGGVIGRVMFTDGSQGRLHVFQVLDDDGRLVSSAVQSLPLGGRPIALEHGVLEGTLVVLDETREELTSYSYVVTALLELARVKTRSLPKSLCPLLGEGHELRAEHAFVTSASDSTLTALRSDPNVTGGLLAAAQAVSTGLHPVDVAASEDGPFVYTADHDAARVSAFAFDEASLQLTPIESEALAPGSQPISLALTPAGRLLIALDRAGRAQVFRVAATDGSLSPLASLALAGSADRGIVRIDALARFAYFAFPAAGSVHVATIHPTNGSLQLRATLGALLEPADVWLGADGRFAYVLDKASASVQPFAIDPLDGRLTSSGAALPLGGSPTRITGSTGIEMLLTGTKRALLAFDAQTERALAIDRTLANGAITANAFAPALLEPGATALLAIDAANFRPVLLSTSDDGSNARLTSWIEVGTSYDWTPVATLPIGRAPHALAKRASAP